MYEMTSVRAVEWVSVPLVPTIVTVYVPRCAMTLVVSVSVVEPVEGFGLNDGLTPDGSPVAEKVTAPEKPPEGTTVIAEVPESPRSILRLVGDALRPKSATLAGCCTVS